MLCNEQLKNDPNPKIILIITDGADNSNIYGVSVAPDIKAIGITIAVVGASNSVLISDLLQIASSDSNGSQLYIPITDFNTFVTSINDVSQTLC